MDGRGHRPQLMAGAAIAAIVSSAALGSPERHTDESYRLTLQVLGGVAGCDDVWSAPDYFADATRRDPKVEEELAAIRQELDRLVPRVEAYDERIEPLVGREHNTVPLTRDELHELEASRERRFEIERELEGTEQDLAPLDDEQRLALKKERREVDEVVQRLEEGIPLSDEEARYLADQREQRAPLATRSGVLETRRNELRDLVTVRTPGWLRVYPNDSLRVRLMEDDSGSDDTCATWAITLDRELLSGGGIDLKRDDRPLVRVSVLPVSP